MDQEDRQHESRRGELPVEPRTGQAFTSSSAFSMATKGSKFVRVG